MRRRAWRCRTSNNCSRDRKRVWRSAKTSARYRRRTSWRWRKPSVGRSSMAGCRGRRLAAQRDGSDIGPRAVGQLTPVHLHVGTEQVTLTDPDALALNAGDARLLFDALRPLFGDAGFTLHWGDAQRWFVEHPSLAELATASLDRVVGRNVDPGCRTARTSRAGNSCSARPRCCCTGTRSTSGAKPSGLHAVNSLWLSGCGMLAEAPQPAPQVDDRLRTPALNEDWTGWRDAGTRARRRADRDVARAGEGATLTLAGERRALPFTHSGASPWQRLRAAWRRSAAHPRCSTACDTVTPMTQGPTLVERDAPPRTCHVLEAAGVHPLLARLFAGRGVRSIDELSDDAARLLPPATLNGARAAAALLADTIDAGQRICIVADYDCDGATRMRRGRARPGDARRAPRIAALRGARSPRARLWPDAGDRRTGARHTRRRC